MHLYRKVVLFAFVIAILVISVIFAVFLFHWLNDYRNSYSLGLDPSEIYRITWSTSSVTSPDITNRDEIEGFVSYLNAWALVEWTPHRWPPGETPPLLISFFGGEGSLIGYWGVYETGSLVCFGPDFNNGRHRIIDRHPVSEFVRRFG